MFRAFVKLDILVFFRDDISYQELILVIPSGKSFIPLKVKWCFSNSHLESEPFRSVRNSPAVDPQEPRCVSLDRLLHLQHQVTALNLRLESFPNRLMAVLKSLFEVAAQGETTPAPIFPSLCGDVTRDQRL